MKTLRWMRLLFDIPANELAKEARVTRRELYRIERGEVLARAATLARIDQAMLRLLSGRIGAGNGA